MLRPVPAHIPPSLPNSLYVLVHTTLETAFSSLAPRLPAQAIIIDAIYNPQKPICAYLPSAIHCSAVPMLPTGMEINRHPTCLPPASYTGATSFLLTSREQEPVDLKHHVYWLEKFGSIIPRLRV